MTIETTCDSCFKTYQLKDALAGRKVRCKECGEVFTVPEPGAARPEAATDPWDIDDPLDDDPFADDPYADDSPSAPPPPMPTKRRRKKRRKKKPQREESSWLQFRVIGILGLVCGALFVMMCMVGIFWRPVWTLMLWGTGLTGLALALIGAIGCLMAAFEEDVMCGVLYLLMPFYPLYFVISRFGDVWKLVLMNIGGTILVIGSIFLAVGIQSFDIGRRAADRAAGAPVEDDGDGFFAQRREAAAQDLDSRENVTQMALAAHNHHDTFQNFPPHPEEAGREAVVSWQTSLLPFVDEESLYDQINRVANWDAPANNEANRTIVRRYVQPSISETTDDRNFAVSHYALNQEFLDSAGGIRIRDILDGISNTVMCGEVGGGYKPWADPSNARDLAAGLSPGPNTFGNPDGEGAFMSLADGSVRWISSDMDPEVLKALGTPDGGEVVDF